MRDEVLAGAALLIGVPFAGEREGLLKSPLVQRLGRIVEVLLQDGEKVAEERALFRIEPLRVLVIGNGERPDLGRADAGMAGGGLRLDWACRGLVRRYA